MTDKEKIEKETREILKSIAKLPPFPAVVVKIIEMMQEDTYDAKELEIYILKDPVITARCIRLCNSAYFRLKQTVTEIQQAIVVLGKDNIFKIVVSAAAGDLALRCKSKDLWMHSVSVSILSNLIYNKIKDDRKVKKALKPNAEMVLYTVSLLHDMGRVIMDQFLERDYQKVQIVRMQGICNCEEVETRLYGMNHSDVGATMLKGWKFPIELVAPIKTHHSIFNEMPTKIKIEHILGFADLLHFSYLWCWDNSEIVISPELLELFNCTEEDLIKFKYELYNELQKTNELLDLDSELEE